MERIFAPIQGCGRRCPTRPDCSTAEAAPSLPKTPKPTTTTKKTSNKKTNPPKISDKTQLSFSNPEVGQGLRKIDNSTHSTYILLLYILLLVWHTSLYFSIVTISTWFCNMRLICITNLKFDIEKRLHFRKLGGRVYCRDCHAPGRINVHRRINVYQRILAIFANICISRNFLHPHGHP